MSLFSPVVNRLYTNSESKVEVEASIPGGGEDRIHHRVLVIAGTKQEDVLCERKQDLVFH